MAKENNRTVMICHFDEVEEFLVVPTIRDADSRAT